MIKYFTIEDLLKHYLQKKFHILVSCIKQLHYKNSGDDTTKEDLDYVTTCLKEIVARLRSMSPLYEDFLKKQKNK